ncbi:hypothetical protein MBLNU457_1906t1 [Dothideomycetes sp. NU457]
MSGNLFHSQEDFNVSEDFYSSPRNKLHGAADIENAEIEVEDSYNLNNQLQTTLDGIHFLSSQNQIQSSLDIVLQTPQGSAVPATPPRTVQPFEASEETGKTMVGKTSSTASLSAATKAGKDASRAADADKLLKSHADDVNQTSGQSSAGRLQKLGYYGSGADISPSQAKDITKRQSKRKPEATKATEDDTFDIPVEHEEAPVAKKRGRSKKNDDTAALSVKQKNSSKVAKVDSQAVKGKNKSRSKQKAAEEDPDDDFIEPTKALTTNPKAQRTVNTRSTRSKQSTARPEPVSSPQQAQAQVQQSSIVRRQHHNRSNTRGGKYENESFAEFFSEVTNVNEHEDEHDDEHEDEPRKQKEPSQYSLGMRIDAQNDDLDISVLSQDEDSGTVEHPVSERTRKMPPPKVPQSRTPVAMMLGSTNKTQQAKTTPLGQTHIESDAKDRKQSIVPFDANGPRIQGTTKTGKSAEDPSVQQDFSIVNRSGTKELVMIAPKPSAAYEPAAGENVQSLLETMNPVISKRNQSVRIEQSRSVNVSDSRASEVEIPGHVQPDSPLSANTGMTSPQSSHSQERRLSEPTKKPSDLEATAEQSVRVVENTVITGREGPVQFLDEAAHQQSQGEIDDQGDDDTDIIAAELNDLVSLSSPDRHHPEILKRVAPNDSPLPTHTARRPETTASTDALSRLKQAVANQEAKKVHFMPVASPHKYAAAQSKSADGLGGRYFAKEESPNIEVAGEHPRTTYRVAVQNATHVDMPKEKGVVQTTEAVIAGQALALALVPTQKAHDVPETSEPRTMKSAKFSELPSADKASSMAAPKVQRENQTSVRRSPERPFDTVSSQPPQETVTRNAIKMLRGDSPDEQVRVPLNKSIGERFQDNTEQEEEGDADVQMLDDDDDDDDDDPDKTLVNEDEVDDQDNDTESGQSEEYHSEPESEIMQSPSQGTDVERDEWRAALAAHQVNLFDSLIEISHQLVRNLVDKESAVGDILSDYRRDGFHLLEQLKLEHRRNIKVWHNSVMQAHSQLRKDLQDRSAKMDGYISKLQQTRKPTPKRNMAAINKQFNVLLQSK